MTTTESKQPTLFGPDPRDIALEELTEAAQATRAYLNRQHSKNECPAAYGLWQRLDNAIKKAEATA